MKKTIIIASIFILALTAGCGKKDENELPKETEKPTISTEVAEQTEGKEQEVPEAAILDTELETDIKDVNKDAVVTGSTNSGEKLLTIRIPMEKDDQIAKKFVSQALQLLKTENLSDSEYAYISIVATSGDENLITASFKKAEKGFKVDKLTAVDKSLEEAVAAESKKITK